MDRRIPYSEKGKEIASEFSPPPRKRIRAPALDTSDLIRENSLTLIGRLTNPSVQRLWSLIPFFSNRWNLRGKAIGSVLGRGCFQFRFDYEEDLLKVLNNRPYHFDDWMVILQRWEPIISETFPSEIPFWIEVQGLPLHYWKPKMLIDIGESAGELIEHELTPTAARVQVLVNGLQPLITEAMIDFPDGSEALVTLEYKRLKKHCSHCNRLSHEKADCPGLLKGRQSQRTSTPQPQQKQAPSQGNNYQRGDKITSKSPYLVSSGSARDIKGKSSDLRSSKPASYSQRRDPNGGSYEYRTPSSRRSFSRSQDYYRGESAREPITYLRQKERSYKNPIPPTLQWREKSFSKDSCRQEGSESSRNRRPPLERDMNKINIPTPPPIPTTDEVMGELRDVTVQYISCTDPTESAARRHRVNQGEAKGLMATTAASIISAAAIVHQMNMPEPKQLPTQASLPVLELGQTSGIMSTAQAPAVKKKRGRPPLAKPANKSPMRLVGAKLSKKQICNVQSSPKRKASQGKEDSPQEEAGTSLTTSSSRRRQNASNVPSSSKVPPKAKIIPPMAKGRMDFQNPSNPLP